MSKIASAPADFDVEAYRKAVALDLRLFAFLHGQEVTLQSLLELKAYPFGYRMALEPLGTKAAQALKVIDEGWAELEGKNSDEQSSVDELGADFASIYLTYKLRASPSESVWFDDDHLMRQGPMFDIRSWYERHGLETGDWQRRADDHLSLQLQFTAHLLDNLDVSLEEPAKFLDEHLLRWIDDFASNVSSRCATPFYAGLAMLTASYVQELRDVIEITTGYARPAPEVDPEQNTENEIMKPQPDILS